MGTGLVVAAVLGLLAAEPTAAGTAPGADRSAARTQYVDFGVADVEGAREGPAQTYFMVAPRMRFESMVRVRGNFLPELQRSADEL